MQFLSENPKIEKSFDKKFLKSMNAPILSQLSSSHDTAEHIGNSDIGSYHKQDFNGNSAYYHYVDNKPREFSIISPSNIQRITSKNDGDSTHIHNFMKYHADKFGEVKSDKFNTKGSQKLWTDVVNNNDSDKYSTIHYDGTTEHKMNGDYLSKKKDSIWNNSDDAMKHSVILRKNV